MTEQRGGACDVARDEQLTDPCRRVDNATRGGFEPEPDDREAELGADPLQQRDVAAASAPEVEVGADDHDPGPSAVDKRLTNEVLRGLAAARLVEVQHEAAIEVTGGIDEL